MTVECSWCTLKIDNDNLHALMCLHSQMSEEELTIGEEIVLDFLKSQNITYGISMVAIQAMLEHAMYEQYVCVAKGKAATKGTDAHIEFKKNTQDMKKKPLINEDGTADYKNSLNLAIISEGELLAEYIPPTEGKGGCDIYGHFIPSLGRGKDILPLRGRGIRADETNTHYYAEYSGHIVMDDSKIYIDKLYRVNGDLNIEVGNITFDGDVEVTGDVRSGMRIDAGGNIFIRGHVGACIINAGKGIFIEKGIQGRSECVISAKEDIICKFVESCKIVAGGNIYADSVLNSVLTATNQVIVTSKHGNIVSSEVYGMAGVIACEVGNSAGVSALLRAGLPREYYVRAAELNKKIKEIDAKIESFNQHLETLDNAPDIRMQIMRAKIVLTSDRTECLDELDKLNAKIAADKENSIINITGTVYEGAKIYLGAFPYIVNESVKEVVFKLGFHGVEVCSVQND